MTNNFAVLIKSLIFTQIFIFCLITGVSIDINSYYLSASPLKQAANIFRPFNNITMDERICNELLKKTSFVLAGDTNNINVRDYFNQKIPRQLLTANIQALAYSETGYIQANVSRNKDNNIELPAINLPETDINTKAVNFERLKKYRVVLYCTHSSESYIPDSGMANLNGGRYGLVNQAAAQIASNLNQKGIKAEYIKTIHDYPDYNQSYTNSRATVKKILESNNQNLWLFDIHRDSIPGLAKAQTVEFNGKNAAPVLIIVGTDERKEHPNWEKNYAFAEQIAAAGQELYPGLIKGIRTKAGTYNQEFHPQSLLLELGSDYNSMAEVNYSAELLADIILEILEEENS
ncbi:MAG TPA: stage II sporulation protein P [Syntrophomonadaceae bacterium]|nr:stage II sporulation protein P [Syntrophomonadaceae bacterium]HPR92569.1 stage II sporulation protein P [Syntrophomonadaceae bacterium]